MRKTLRFLFLSVALLSMPAANAIDMRCFPGSFAYDPSIGGWRCEFSPGGTHCLVCYDVIVVEG